MRQWQKFGGTQGGVLAFGNTLATESVREVMKESVTRARAHARLKRLENAKIQAAMLDRDVKCVAAGARLYRRRYKTPRRASLGDLNTWGEKMEAPVQTRKAAMTSLVAPV